MYSNYLQQILQTPSDLPKAIAIAAPLGIFSTA
jgi:hypothetical protein